MPSYERWTSEGEERGSSRGTLQSESPLTVEAAIDEDEEEEEDLEPGMMLNPQHQPSFQLSLSEMTPPINTTNCENCTPGDDNFYNQLTSLKQQNIFHLQQLENELYDTPGRHGDGEKYKRSGSSRSDKRPLFVLDMPCYCDEKSSRNTNYDQFDEVLEEEEENNEDNFSLDENIEALFDGVTDDSDLDEDVVISRRNGNSGKRSIRVQSAPTIIDEKRQQRRQRPFSAIPHSFKPTEVKPFKMTVRQVKVFWICHGWL